MNRRLNNALLWVATIVCSLLLIFAPFLVVYLAHQQGGWMGASLAGMVLIFIYLVVFSYKEADDTVL